MRALITGAAGLIGTALSEKLLAEGYELACLSRADHLDQKYVRWIKHDLARDSWETLPKLKIDVVFHLAGQTSAYQARKDPAENAKANILGSINLFEYLRSLSKMPFVVTAGTATEVGLSEKLPICESMCDRPITFYDISKLAAEMYLMQYIREGWLRGCSLRLGNVFGRINNQQNADRGVLDRVFSQALSGKSITIYGDGSCLRDYIFIDDVISALVAAIKNPDETCGHYFYIGTGKGTSLTDAFTKVVAIAEKQTGSSSLIQYVLPPEDLSPIEYRNSIIDSTAFYQATGWIPIYDLDSGLIAACQSLFKS